MSTLILHNPKFDSKLVPFAALEALPRPEALGPHHKPVPHARLVEGLREEIVRRDFRVVREQYALGRNGAALFGVLNMEPVGGAPGTSGLAFGVRNSTDTSMGLRGVAGRTVFVCDNLALSGETFAISRKNTTGLDLMDAIARGFDKFLAQSAAFELEIARLAAATVTDALAKTIVYDAFANGIAPSRLFDDVNTFYFKATTETPETRERTLWALHNAFTRAFRDLTPQRRLGATVALGKHFEQVIDAEFSVATLDLSTRPGLVPGDVQPVMV